MDKPVSAPNDSPVQSLPGEDPVAERRAFLKASAKVAATAPAVALLLSAGTKPGLAQPPDCGFDFRRCRS